MQPKTLKEFLKQNEFILDIFCSDINFEDNMSNTYSVIDIENRRTFSDRLNDLKAKLYTAFVEVNTRKDGEERTAEEQKQYVMFYFALQIAWLVMTDKLWHESKLDDEEEQFKIHSDDDEGQGENSGEQKSSECDANNN